MEFYRSSFLRVSDSLSRAGYLVEYDTDKFKEDGFILIRVNHSVVVHMTSWKSAYTWLCGFKECLNCVPLIEC